MRAALALLAATALIAPASTPRHVLTYQVVDHVALGDPDLYVAIAVLDPHISEVLGAYLIKAPRRLFTDYSWSGSPNWSERDTGARNDLDITAAQLAQVEKGVRALGFSENAVHGWIVSAPVGFDSEHGSIQSLRVGEVLVDLGPFSQAATSMARFTAGAVAPLRKLGAEANAHVAFSANVYYQPKCSAIAIASRAALGARSREATGSLENAIGTRLRLLDVIPSSDSAMLCPDVRPVSIEFTLDWYPPWPVAYRNGLIGGTARYEIGAVMPRATTPPTSPSVVDVDSNFETQTQPFTDLGAERYAVTTSLLSARVAPSVALLSFDYFKIPRQQIDAKIMQLGAVGVTPDDVLVEPFTVSTTRLWVRVAPANNERARQIKNAIGPLSQTTLALFTSDCSGEGSALANALERSRAHAQDIARLLHSGLGPLLSVRIARSGISNASCGYSSGATIEQLVRAARYRFNFSGHEPEPMLAEFSVRVDAAWSMDGVEGAQVESDRSYKGVSSDPSCQAAERSALKQAIDAALVDNHQIWSLMERGPFFEPNKGTLGCRYVESTITVLRNP